MTNDRQGEAGHAPTSTFIAKLRSDQHECWRRGERVPVEMYVSREHRLRHDAEALLDLVFSEVLLREESGETPQLEEYVKRFPHLESQLRRQFAVHEALGESAASDAGTKVNHPTGGGASGKTASGPARPDGAPKSAGGYEIIRELGRGGMGVVYQARQVYTKRLVALKMILSGSHAGPRELSRFRTEAEAVARLQHPNIVQVYEAGVLDDRPFLALEFVDGVSLAKNLGGAPLPPRTAATWTETLARAVHYAHLRGIVHRDLKPANILVASNPGPASDDNPRDVSQPPAARHPPLAVLKITDFGLAKLIDRGAAGTTSGAIMGTPSYMAPEQAAGHSQQIGPATDVYALGAILYEMLTGQPPFRGPTALDTLDLVRRSDPFPPSGLQPNLPHDIEMICLTCLQKEPNHRYPTAEALADDLRAYLAGQPYRARPITRRQRLAQWVRRRPLAAVLLPTAAIGIIGVAVGSFLRFPLVIGSSAALGTFFATWWYNSHLRRALRTVTQQQLVANRFIERLHLLLELTPRIIAAANLDELLLSLAETTARLADAELATIYVVDRQRGELWSKVTLDNEVGEIRVPLGVGLCGAVAVSGEPINTPDAYADPRFNPDIDRRTGRKTRNLLTLPMIARDGRVSGVFQVINKHGGAFTAEDVNILNSLAASAAAAVETALDRRGPS